MPTLCAFLDIGRKVQLCTFFSSTALGESCSTESVRHATTVGTFKIALLNKWSLMVLRFEMSDRSKSRITYSVLDHPVKPKAQNMIANLNVTRCLGDD